MVRTAQKSRADRRLVTCPLIGALLAPLKNTYVRMLFIDYSSAFNTILPHQLLSKLRNLRLWNTLCWVLDFLTNRTQSVRLGNHISSTLSLSTGFCRVVCSLSPLLYTLLSHDCSPSFPDIPCLFHLYIRKWHHSCGAHNKQRRVILS